MSYSLALVTELQLDEVYIDSPDSDISIHECSLLEQGAWNVYLCLTGENTEVSGAVLLHASVDVTTIEDQVWMYQAKVPAHQVLLVSATDLEYEDKDAVLQQGQPVRLPADNFCLVLEDNGVAFSPVLNHNVIQAFYGGSCHRILGLRLL